MQSREKGQAPTWLASTPVKNWFRLTPSCAARRASRACRLRGTLTRNFPLYACNGCTTGGTGIALPAARAACTQAAMASCASRAASASVVSDGQDSRLSGGEDALLH